MEYFTLVATVLPLIMEAVQMAETLTGMTGPEKFATVMSFVTSQLPAGLTQNASTQTRITGWINMAVAMFNIVHPLFQKTPVATAATTVVVAPVVGTPATA